LTSPYSRRSVEELVVEVDDDKTAVGRAAMVVRKTCFGMVST